VTTKACNAPATVTAAGPTAPAGLRPDADKNTYTWAAWTTSPSDCLKHMTYVVTGPAALSSQIDMTGTNTDITKPTVTFKGNAASATHADQKAWGSLLKTSPTFTISMKTAMGVAIVDAAK